MESRWRRNLCKYGLVGVQFSLCARMLLAPQWLLTNFRQPNVPQLVTIVSPPELSGLDHYLTQVVFTNPLLNFPYGFFVEPDLPP